MQIRAQKYQKSIVLSDIFTRLIILMQEKQLPIGIIDLVKILNACSNALSSLYT
jgi:hypothetical protein